VFALFDVNVSIHPPQLPVCLGISVEHEHYCWKMGHIFKVVFRLQNSKVQMD